MALTDVPAVVAVERASYLFPWSEGVFRDCIRVGYLCRVVEAANEVAGYGIMSQGAGEAHILNICIRDDLRSGGVGRRLMLLLLERARAAQMQDVFLEVRPSNPVAIRLYESLGFARVGVRKGYYQATGGREDAWVYKLPLSAISP
jgi:ribosomal-protein-alanine N-acetyltransferase